MIALAILGIGGSTYAGRLTGFFGDPNAGAFFIAVLGTLAVFFCDDRTKVRVAVAVPMVIGLALCFSRTGLLAGAFVAVWVLLGRRLGTFGGAATGRRSGLAGRQHPGEPDDLRALLRPLRQ